MISKIKNRLFNKKNQSKNGGNIMDTYKIIALRDIDSKCKKEFESLDTLESKQIRNGYTNPLLVANILTMRCKILINKEQ